MRHRDYNVTDAPGRARLSGAAAALVSFLIASFSASSVSAAVAAETKRVVLFYSFGREFKPWSEYARIIQAELQRQAPWPVQFTEHSLMYDRFPDPPSEAALATYLRALYASLPPDLIVSIGAPAANFVQRHRAQLFGAAPMLLTAVEQRRIQFANLSADDAVVAVAHDLPAVIENILNVLPNTKSVMVVNGTSPLEKFWLEEMRREFKPFEGRIALSYTNNLSLDGLLQKAATLPPNSAIFWELLVTDAAGVIHMGDTALRRLHAVANAPIFSFDDSFFGEYLVGGPMHSVLETGKLTAEAAVRILRGEKPADVKMPFVGFAAPKFDWREMRRWSIDESRLLPGSTILFRDPTAWERYRWQLITTFAALLLQTTLIGWLVYEHYKRHIAEVSARNTMFELAHMNRIATVGELSASIAHEVNQPLATIASGADAAVNWLSAKSPNVDEARFALARIHEAVHRAADIVKNLRAMFKKDGQDKSPVDVNDTILGVLALVRVELEEHGIEVQTELEDALPRVNGIETQLQQVTLNLIMNAIEAMNSEQLPSRELRVKSKLIPHAVEVSIEDSGTGISLSDLQRLFEPMFTTKERGMGMGLTICQSIVQDHGGRIWATAGHNQGTIFHFVLPTPDSTI